MQLFSRVEYFSHTFYKRFNQKLSKIGPTSAFFSSSPTDGGYVVPDHCNVLPCHCAGLITSLFLKQH